MINDGLLMMVVVVVVGGGDQYLCLPRPLVTFASLSHLPCRSPRRFLVCGGDGTVTWVLHEIEEP